jgi:hypothetical protein
MVEPAHYKQQGCGQRSPCFAADEVAGSIRSIKINAIQSHMTTNNYVAYIGIDWVDRK